MNIKDWKAEFLLFPSNNCFNIGFLRWRAEKAVHSQCHLMKLFGGNFSIYQFNHCSDKLLVHLPHFNRSCSTNFQFIQYIKYGVLCPQSHYRKVVNITFFPSMNYLPSKFRLINWARRPTPDKSENPNIISELIGQEQLIRNRKQLH